PELCYILLLQQPAAGSNFLNIFWVYSYVSKVWTRMTLLLSNTLGIRDCRTIYKYLLDGSTPTINATWNQPVWGFQASAAAPVFYTMPDPPSASNTASQLVFPVELIAPLRDVTVDCVVLWTPLTDGSTITPSINGTAYQQVVTNVPDAQGGTTQYFRSFPNTKTPANTFKSPQLTINTVGSAPLGHIVIYGSQTPSRPV
ncbi:MAG TPA: hypothetical protein VGF75_05590, partial [Candidatus Saccharimonadales bacterium]